MATKIFPREGRFSSCPVSTDQYLVTAIQYILRNPGNAKIVRQLWNYKWSSASFHCGINSHDILVQNDELLTIVRNWKQLLSVDGNKSNLLEEKNRTGRPFCPNTFYDVVKQISGVDTQPKKPGRPSGNQ